MRPERHQRIGELYHGKTPEFLAEQRAAFLAQACGGDEGLRREVESLLARDSKAESFIESPALEIAAKAVAADRECSLIGKRVDHYQILSLLGAGGMERSIARVIRDWGAKWPSRCSLRSIPPIPIGCGASSRKRARLECSIIRIS